MDNIFLFQKQHKYIYRGKNLKKSKIGVPSSEGVYGTWTSTDQIKSTWPRKATLQIDKKQEQIPVCPLSEMVRRDKLTGERLVVLSGVGRARHVMAWCGRPTIIGRFIQFLWHDWLSLNESQPIYVDILSFEILVTMIGTIFLLAHLNSEIHVTIFGATFLLPDPNSKIAFDPVPLFWFHSNSNWSSTRPAQCDSSASFHMRGE